MADRLLNAECRQKPDGGTVFRDDIKIQILIYHNAPPNATHITHKTSLVFVFGNGAPYLIIPTKKTCC